jgi:hypothetical protein
VKLDGAAPIRCCSRLVMWWARTSRDQPYHSRCSWSPSLSSSTVTCPHGNCATGCSRNHRSLIHVAQLRLDVREDLHARAREDDDAVVPQPMTNGDANWLASATRDLVSPAMSPSDTCVQSRKCASSCLRSQPSPSWVSAPAATVEGHHPALTAARRRRPHPVRSEYRCRSTGLSMSADTP